MTQHADDGLPPLAPQTPATTSARGRVVARMVARFGAPSIEDYRRVYASFRLAGYSLWPLGRIVVRNPAAGAASLFGNVLWFLVAGWWLVLGHLVAGVLLMVTIIGIPFGIASIKLGVLALAPLGADVVAADPGTIPTPPPPATRPDPVGAPR